MMRLPRMRVLSLLVLMLGHSMSVAQVPPAQRLGLGDRGVLKVGLWADVVIFDPELVRDVATFENPNQLSQGMEYVLVNGIPVIAEGKPTGALPGKVLRGPGCQPPQP